MRVFLSLSLFLLLIHAHCTDGHSVSWVREHIGENLLPKLCEFSLRTSIYAQSFARTLSSGCDGIRFVCFPLAVRPLKSHHICITIKFVIFSLFVSIVSPLRRLRKYIYLYKLMLFNLNRKKDSNFFMHAWRSIFTWFVEDLNVFERIFLLLKVIVPRIVAFSIIIATISIFHMRAQNSKKLDSKKKTLFSIGTTKRNGFSFSFCPSRSLCFFSSMLNSEK